MPPPETATNVSLLVVEPSPSWPLPLYPHDQSVPSVLVAKVKRNPAATDLQFVPPIKAATGDVLVIVELSPSCPPELLPQPHNVPSVFMAAVCVFYN